MNSNIKKQPKLLETVYLYDKDDEKNYTVILSNEDAEKCNEDPEYASYILSLAKECQEGQVEHGEQTSDSQLIHEPKDGHLWTYRETMGLISSYKEYNEKFKKSKNKVKFWEMVSKNLERMGYVKDSRKCEVKWRNLIRTHKIIKNSKNGKSSRFQFFDRIDEVVTGEKMIKRIKNELEEKPVESIETKEDVTQSDTEQTQTPSQKKLKRNLAELVKLKIKYFRQKEESQAAKERRKDEKLQLQKRLLQLEEKKVQLLEKYLDKT